MIQDIWDSLFQNKRILVIGSTPAKASSAVFSIASMSYPLLQAHVIPYISITDPRFTNFIKKSPYKENVSMIVGVSNIIAEEITKGSFDIVLYIGFEQSTIQQFSTKNNKYQHRKNNQYLNNGTNNDLCSDSDFILRNKLFLNTERLKKSINDSLIEMANENIIDLLYGKIYVHKLVESLKKNKVSTNADYEEFAEKLIYTHLFCNERKRILTSELAQMKLILIDPSQLIGNERELKNIGKIYARAAINAVNSSIAKKMKLILKDIVLKYND
ncbi:hypothetical protein TRFO_30065 [Tritrichomonas foetus]|uniref:Uncharacterized protein n=1 Tax=Tritrichomonas foetus TaxID=1144522 RepID=A0A1J4JUD6_9EUKA|nr:hypothetical protein TRFO_30065 [Tritrichomonas foetus]|eukprot:OHT02753.1 hypothetical protein TRFO_30065 [Tritrichomonas foetus]